MKKGDVGWLNASLKSTETRDTVKKAKFPDVSDRAEFRIPFPAQFLEKLRKVQE